MRMLALALVIVAGLLALLATHQKLRSVPNRELVKVVSAAPVKPPPSLPPTLTARSEPDEASLRRIVEEEYASIERSGGVPLIVTATGQTVVSHPTLHSVRKEKCREMGAGSGKWECGVALMVSERNRHRPMEDAERAYVKRGPSGDPVSRSVAVEVGAIPSGFVEG